MISENRFKCCNRLFSLWVEFVIAIFTLIHVLLTTAEILIYFNIIQVPRLTSQSNGYSKVASTWNESFTSQTNSSGDRCSYHTKHADLEQTLRVIDYVTLVISSLFFIEAIAKGIFLGKHFFKDPWQMFDFTVITCSLGIQIAFCVKHDTIICYHLATKAASYVICLRLWRIPQACSVRKHAYVRKHESDTEYITRLNRDLEKKYNDLEALCKWQEEEIRVLVTELHEQKIQETNTLHSASVLNGTCQADSIIQRSLKNCQENITANIQVDIVEAKKNRRNSIAKADSLPRHTSYDVSDNALQRNDSDSDAKAYDSGIEVKDSFRSDIDTKSIYHEECENTAAALDINKMNSREGKAVIESDMFCDEITEQSHFPCISSCVKDKPDESLPLNQESSETAECYENEAFSCEDVMEGMRTYKSPDGIPMTEL